MTCKSVLAYMLMLASKMNAQLVAEFALTTNTTHDNRLDDRQTPAQFHAGPRQKGPRFRTRCGPAAPVAS